MVCSGSGITRASLRSTIITARTPPAPLRDHHSSVNSDNRNVVVRGLLDERGTLNQLSQSTACRVERSFWCLRRGRLFFCKEAPHLAGITHLASQGSCGWLMWRTDTFGYSKSGELGSYVAPRRAALAIRGKEALAW